MKKKTLAVILAVLGSLGAVMMLIANKLHHNGWLGLSYWISVFVALAGFDLLRRARKSTSYLKFIGTFPAGPEVNGSVDIYEQRKNGTPEQFVSSIALHGKRHTYLQSHDRNMIKEEIANAARLFAVRHHELLREGYNLFVARTTYAQGLGNRTDTYFILATVDKKGRLDLFVKERGTSDMDNWPEGCRYRVIMPHHKR